MIAYLNNNKIRNIHFHQTGGGSGNGLDFSEIGYEKAPQDLQDAFDYAKQIYDNWDASITDRSSAFNGDKRLGYFPAVDTSNVENMQDMFAKSNLSFLPTNLHTPNVNNLQYTFGGCTNLQSLDLSNWNTSKVTNMQYTFSGCTNLQSLDLSNWNTSNVTSMFCLFSYCQSLTTLDLSSFDTSKVTNINNMFKNCYNLKKILGRINLKGINTTFASNNFIGLTSQSILRQLTFENIGYGNNMTSFEIKRIQNWGVNTEEIPDARQSLIDSLITYSFDRASNGLSTCTITLYSNSKAVLTAEEIAQITSKGYTIA